MSQLTEWKDVFVLIDKINAKIKLMTGVYSEVNRMKEYYVFIYKCKQLYSQCTCRVKLCGECRQKIEVWMETIG